MTALNDTWEYLVEEVDDSSTWDYITQSRVEEGGMLKHRLKTWGAQGWEVISCLVPNPRNYNRFRVIAKRRTGCTQW